MNDQVGITRNNADLYAIFRTYEISLGRQLTIARNCPDSADLLCIVNPDKKLRLKGKRNWEPEHIPALRLKVHSPTCLQILADPDELYDSMINDAFRRFKTVRHALAVAGGKTKKRSEEDLQSEQERIRSAILNQLLGNVDDKLSSARSVLAITVNELELCKTHQVDLMKRIELATQEVKDLEEIPKDALKDQMVDKAIEGVMKLYTSGAYSSVEFTLTDIEAITTPVWIKFNKLYYYMGTYKVSVPYNGSGVRITAVIRPPEIPPGDYPHPHVSSSGSPCLGNISKAVPQYLKRGSYGILLGLIKEFLESYNPKSPYRRLDDYWIGYTEKEREEFLKKGTAAEDIDDDDDNDDDDDEEFLDEAV